jgi:hypothetical protein
VTESSGPYHPDHPPKSIYGPDGEFLGWYHEPDAPKPTGTVGATSIWIRKADGTVPTVEEVARRQELHQLGWRNERRRALRSLVSKARAGVDLGPELKPEYLRGMAEAYVVEDWMSTYVAEATRQLQALSLELAEALESPRRPHHPKGDGVPSSIAQQTFQEMRNLGIALSDGPSGRRWLNVDGETAMVHIVPDQPLHVRFSPSSMLLSWWSEPPTYARLRAELKEAGAPAVLLAHVAVGLILERGSVTVSLDDLRHAIGWTRREADLTQAQLRRVWRMLLLISSMPVIGKRNETYRDRRTKQVLNLVSDDPLIVVRGRRWPDDASSQTDMPYDVTLDGGAWIDQYRGNRSVLTDFGNILQLAAIPAGKPAGAWAQSIGLALNQRWRERAARTDVARVGEDSHQTVRFRQPFTRRDLLELFRADPYYRDILETEPARARKYWDAAITILKGQKVIGHYAEIEPGPRGRQGWKNAWLDQPLDIRPAEQGRQDVAEISRAATVAAAKARRSRQRTAGQR